MIDDKATLGILGTALTYTTGEMLHLWVSIIAGIATLIYMCVSIYKKLKD
jgi:hypothetical protein